jgi:hypothetical protein
MTYFVSLKLVALVVGLFYLATHLVGALAPRPTLPLLRALPRNRTIGVVLMLAATIWFVTLTGLMDLGELSNMRGQLMAVWAVAGILMAIFVPEFLSLRALGCLLLLAAAVILDAAFLVLTPARYVMTLLAYGWVVLGMILVYSPHLGRDAILYMTATTRRCQFAAWPGVAFGLLLIVLALAFYP